MTKQRKRSRAKPLSSTTPLQAASPSQFVEPTDRADFLVDEKEHRKRKLLEAQRFLTGGDRGHVVHALNTLAACFSPTPKYMLDVIPSSELLNFGLLFGLLQDSCRDSAERRQVIGILRLTAHMNPCEIAEALVKLVGNDNDNAVAVIEAIAECGDDAASIAIQPIARLLLDDRGETRDAALHFVARHCNECTVTALAEIYTAIKRSSDPAWQCQLMRVLLDGCLQGHCDEANAKSLAENLTPQLATSLLRRVGRNGQRLRRAISQLGPVRMLAPVDPIPIENRSKLMSLAEAAMQMGYSPEDKSRRSRANVGKAFRKWLKTTNAKGYEQISRNRWVFDLRVFPDLRIGAASS